MARTKRGVVTRAKHKKVLKSVKGQYGRRKNTIRIARQAMEKAMQYAYRDRKAKKRDIWEMSDEAKKVSDRWDNVRRSGGKTSFSETSD